MNLAQHTQTASNAPAARNPVHASASTTPRYRSREFGVGYGRSEGYARRHSLWQGNARSRYC